MFSIYNNDKIHQENHIVANGHAGKILHIATPNSSTVAAGDSRDNATNLAVVLTVVLQYMSVQLYCL